MNAARVGLFMLDGATAAEVRCFRRRAECDHERGTPCRWAEANGRCRNPDARRAAADAAIRAISEEIVVAP